MAVNTILVTNEWTLISEGSCIFQAQENLVHFTESATIPAEDADYQIARPREFVEFYKGTGNLYGLAPAGSYVAIVVGAPGQTPSFDDFQAKDFALAVNQGLVPGHSYVDKFGENPDIDTGSTPEDIWEIGGIYLYDADGTAPIVSLISDSAADLMPIEVQGLDIDGNLVTQEITLTGTTRVALTTPLWRVFRMSNVGSINISGSVYCYTGAGGIPTTGLIRAVINNGNNQTLMAIYTVPKGFVGFLYRGELGLSRSQTSGAAEAAYYSRRFGKVFRVKKRVDMTNSGNSIYQDYRTAPDIIPSLTDVKLRIEAVSANNAGVFGTFDIMLVDETLFPTEYLQSIGQPGY